MSTRTLEQRSSDYHRALPGVARASLIDHGIAADVIDRYRLGWDGTYITVPVRDRTQRLIFLETWDPDQIGTPSTSLPLVELFPWQLLGRDLERVVFAEGIHEALVLQSTGIDAVAATGTGRFFKERDWAPALADVHEVLVAFKRGERAERRKWLLDRQEVIQKILLHLPNARRLEWPREVGEPGGAFEFFVGGRRGRDDFEQLTVRP